MFENINAPKPRAYRIEQQDRHAYDLLVIYPNKEVISEYESPIGTLRFDKHNEAEQNEKQWWMQILNRLTQEEILNFQRQQEKSQSGIGKN